MSSKKKVLVAIIALAMLILAAIIAIVAVLAAQQVSISSQVNISYKADAEVVGSVSANYATQNGTTKNLGSVSFDGEEDNGAIKDLNPVGNLSFEKGTNEYIEFTFTFVNESHVALYTATLAFTDGSYSTGIIENMSLEGRLSTTLTYSTVSTDDLTQLTTVEVPKGQTVTYILKVSIASKARDAAFNGTIHWHIEATRVD